MATVGRWLAGHSLFIAGQPNTFSPILARHFSFVEGMMLPAHAALCGTHYLAAMMGHAERRTIMHSQMLEMNSRTDALTFWSNHSPNRRDEWQNVAFRVGIVACQAVAFPFWLMVAAWSPASVHACLATATDLLQQKYVATARNAPHDFYTPTIDRLTSAKHAHSANSNLNPDFAAALFLTLLLFIRMRS